MTCQKWYKKDLQCSIPRERSDQRSCEVMSTSPDTIQSARKSTMQWREGNAIFERTIFGGDFCQTDSVFVLLEGRMWTRLHSGWTSTRCSDPIAETTRANRCIHVRAISHPRCSCLDNWQLGRSSRCVYNKYFFAVVSLVDGFWHVGVCLPASCTSEELQLLLRPTLNVQRDISNDTSEQPIFHFYESCIDENTYDSVAFSTAQSLWFPLSVVGNAIPNPVCNFTKPGDLTPEIGSGYYVTLWALHRSWSYYGPMVQSSYEQSSEQSARDSPHFVYSAELPNCHQ